MHEYPDIDTCVEQHTKWFTMLLTKHSPSEERPLHYLTAIYLHLLLFKGFLFIFIVLKPCTFLAKYTGHADEIFLFCFSFQLTLLCISETQDTSDTRKVLICNAITLRD